MGVGVGVGGYRTRGETDGQMEEKAEKEVEEREEVNKSDISNSGRYAMRGYGDGKFIGN